MKHETPNLAVAGQPARPDLESALLSHDLRSALSRIVSGSQMLEAECAPETASGYIAQIKSAALYMVDLLNSADPASTQAAETDLAAALTQLKAMWCPVVAQKGLGLSFVPAGLLPDRLAMPSLDFMRVLNNIIGNALKFTTVGDITVQLRQHGAHDLLIEVADDGPGFDEALQGRLFTLHGRPEASTTSGSGLGLYICKTLMEGSGGEIAAKTRSIGGAKVSLVFRGRQQEKQAVKPSRTGLPDLSHLSILLAEDNPTNQLVATQMLKKMNASVETAPDGVEAMAQFAQGHFNLGLIDIEMPRKSGLEVMREIRAGGCTAADMKLVALTAYVLPEHKARISDAGADGIIAKPLTDIAGFGNAILMIMGEGQPPAEGLARANSDSDIDLDIYNGLKEIIGPDSMLELLDKVQTDMLDVQSGISEGVAQRDTVPIRAKTHILISVAGAIGAVNLQHLAEALNATAKSGDWGRIVAESERCEKGISDVLCFVSAELGRK